MSNSLQYLQDPRINIIPNQKNPIHLFHATCLRPIAELSLHVNLVFQIGRYRPPARGGAIV